MLNVGTAPRPNGKAYSRKSCINSQMGGIAIVDGVSLPPSPTAGNMM